MYDRKLTTLLDRPGDKLEELVIGLFSTLKILLPDIPESATEVNIIVTNSGTASAYACTWDDTSSAWVCVVSAGQFSAVGSQTYELAYKIDSQQYWGGIGKIKVITATITGIVPQPATPPQRTVCVSVNGVYADSNGNIAITTTAIAGVVDAVSDLPTTATEGTAYLVGTAAPRTIYVFHGTAWEQAGGGSSITVDSALDKDSVNPLQNKEIYARFMLMTYDYINNGDTRTEIRVASRMIYVVSKTSNIPKFDHSSLYEGGEYYVLLRSSTAALINKPSDIFKDYPQAIVRWDDTSYCPDGYLLHVITIESKSTYFIEGINLAHSIGVTSDGTLATDLDK